MLGQRRRRSPSIKPTLIQRFLGRCYTDASYTGQSLTITQMYLDSAQVKQAQSVDTRCFKARQQLRLTVKALTSLYIYIYIVLCI